MRCGAPIGSDMASETTTYDQTSVPSVTLTREISDTTGRATYRAEIEILELSPTRTETAEERVKGIISLDPPTVAARSPNELIRLGVEACGNAYQSTDGYSLDAEVLTRLSYSVSHSLLMALRQLGEDV